MQFLLYIIFRFFVGIFSIIPFKIFYFLSNGIAFLLEKVFKYRYNVVEDNLKKSFPEKTEREINDLISKSYKNLSDIILEGIKGYGISGKQILHRYYITNPEILNKFYENGRDAIAVGAHYANWEWGAVASGIQLKHKAAVLYKPLSNKYIDKFIKEKRSSHGAKFISIYNTKKYFLSKKNKPVIYIMGADQSPSNLKKAFRVVFFNRKTAFLHGPEVYAKQLNLPVVYFDVKRINRGFYTLTIKEIVKSPTELKEGELTQKYAHFVESVIKNAPENWLWSHRRWKHKL